MIDYPELTKAIEESGVKKTFIARKLNVCYATFLRKLSGDSEITVEDAGIIADAIKLDSKRKKAIFFK